jgi:hypothetical protein
MAILYPNVPGDGAAVISQALAPLSRQPGTIASKVVAGADDDGSIHFDFSAPHPVFIADLEDVARGSLLKGARPDGWRYLLMRDEQVVGSATVDWDEADGFSFSHVTQGPYVDSTREAIERAERLPEVRSEDFELRLLDVPALRVRALWLAGKQRDLLIPLRPAPPPVEVYQPCTEERLVDALRDSATRLLSAASERLI